MGHISMSGRRRRRWPPSAGLDVERRVFVHINNSNPVLREDSPERARGASRPAGRSPSTAWRSACEPAAERRRSWKPRSAQVGAERYHDKHPFHHLLHGGKLNKGQVQAWALNRYCYQSGVPRKDAALMSRVHDRELRREWVHRILDHDGADGEEGGIERWLVLTDALGLDRAYVISMQGALPATRFAVEAYVTFVRERTLVEAVASSLTELFAPSIHRERISGMLENYDFIGERAMQYFRAAWTRPTATPISRSTTSSATPPTPEQQAAAVDAVRFKCNVLWAQLDALHHAYVDAGADPARRVPAGGRMSEARKVARHRHRPRPSRRCRAISSCATMRPATAGPSWRRSGSSRPMPSPSRFCSFATAPARVDDIADRAGAHLQCTEGPHPGRHHRRCCRISPTRAW